MNIYVAHSRSFDYKKDLYQPIRNSKLNDKFTFVLPHESSDEPFNSKDYLAHHADVMIAEVSERATGLGIELGWADVYLTPIICIYKKGTKLSGSLKVVSNHFVEYSNGEDIISGIQKAINELGLE